MKKIENVHGSQPEKPRHVEVNVDTVYIRDNIRHEKVEEVGSEVWIYDEVQYSYPEFFTLYVASQDEKIQTLQGALDDMMLLMV